MPGIFSDSIRRTFPEDKGYTEMVFQRIAAARSGKYFASFAAWQERPGISGSMIWNSRDFICDRDVQSETRFFVDHEGSIRE